MKVKKTKNITFPIFAIVIFIVGFLIFCQYKKEKNNLKVEFTKQLETISLQLSSKTQELETLKNEDQIKKNKLLETEIKNIQTTYQQTVKIYDDLIDLRMSDIVKTQKINAQFSSILSFLVGRNYASASASLAILEKDIKSLQSQIATKTDPIPENTKVTNSPPNSGYSKQVVEVEGQKFLIDIFAASLDSTKVQVETASQNDCGNNCPVSSLADFVSKSGGFAGINGPYFCPAEYPSCSNKTNSFDTLLMNKNKYYFNSDNNVYSSVPAMIFSGNSVRLVEKSLEWGRDTNVDAVIASQPLLISGGEIRFHGDSDVKRSQKGPRCFMAAKGNIVYIGLVRNATTVEATKVLKTLGVQSAINLDSGGSTAFYVNGKYIAGPGRQTPFGIVLVRK